jgi:hypothetical protein
MTVHITHRDHASMHKNHFLRLDTTLASSWVQHSATASTGWASSGSELWSCDLADGRWSTHWDTDTAHAPVATRGAGAVLSPSTSTVYVFGGEYGTGAVYRVNSLHTLTWNTYDGSDRGQWGLVNASTTGDAPEARSGHTMTPLLDEAGSTSGLLVYAGLSCPEAPNEACRSGAPLSDVHAFSFASASWRRLTPEVPTAAAAAAAAAAAPAAAAAVAVTAAAPAARHGHAASLLGGGLRLIAVFGGGDRSGQQPRVYGDLHLFDAAREAWVTPATVGEAPAPRDGHSMCAVGGHIFVFGGVGAPAVTSSSD